MKPRHEVVSKDGFWYCPRCEKIIGSIDEAWDHARTDPFTGQIENRLDILFELIKEKKPE